MLTYTLVSALSSFFQFLISLLRTLCYQARQECVVSAQLDKANWSLILNSKPEYNYYWTSSAVITFSYDLTTER